MKAIRVVVVDPQTERVWEDTVELVLEHLYQLLGCRGVDLVALGHEPGTYIYCDDVGLYRTPDDAGRLPITWLKGHGYPLVGRLVLVGPPDGEGDDTDCPLTVEEVQNRIVWMGCDRLPPVPETRVFMVRRE
jgi:hypothetical protein